MNISVRGRPVYLQVRPRTCRRSPSAHSHSLTVLVNAARHNTAIISSRSHTFFMSWISLFFPVSFLPSRRRVQTFRSPYPSAYNVIRSCGRRSFKSADKCPPTAARRGRAGRPVRGGVTLSLRARGRPRPDVCNKRARTRTFADDKHEPAADVRSFGAIDSISFYYYYFLAPRKHDGEGEKNKYWKQYLWVLAPHRSSPDPESVARVLPAAGVGCGWSDAFYDVFTFGRVHRHSYLLTTTTTTTINVWRKHRFQRRKFRDRLSKLWSVRFGGFFFIVVYFITPFAFNERQRSRLKQLYS